MELDYKHNLIKSLLNKIKDFDKNCKDIEIDEVRSFVSSKVKKEDKKSKPIRYYKESSTANFEINCQNQELNRLFLEIKETIKKNAKTCR